MSARRTAVKNHHLAVTEKLIAELERGCAPWVRPWGGSALPMNIATKRLYRGANILSLWLAQQAAGYPSAQWLSYRQAMGLGGCVRKGEHGTPIFFYSSLKEDESEERTRTIPLLRSYTVFNVAQCDGLPAPQPEVEKPIMPEAAGVFAQVEACIAKIEASIHHGGPRAYYSPTSDEIGLPVPESFLAPEHYFATSLHEHAHWSGATTRLAREFGKAMPRTHSKSSSPNSPAHTFAQNSACRGCCSIPNISHTGSVSSKPIPARS